MQVVAYAVYLLLGVIEILLLIRAVMSWIPSAREGKFMQVLYTLTEPFIAPVRALLMRIEAVRNLPIDLSFLIVFILLQVVMNMVLMLV